MHIYSGMKISHNYFLFYCVWAVCTSKNPALPPHYCANKYKTEHVKLNKATLLPV